jgi:hypothetical protein
MLAVAGVLAVAAGFLFFFSPQTVDNFAGRIGLTSQAVGPVRPAVQASAPKPETAKESRHAGIAQFFKSKATVAGGQSVAAVEAADPQPAGDKAKASPVPVQGQTVQQAVIKATSIEQKHLIEKYMYLSGDVRMLVDGRPVLAR